MRPIAVAGWIVIFGALFAWQAIGIARGSDWPTMSDMLRAFMRLTSGRVVLFGAWLWIGWHLFVRSSNALIG
jgi:hypothetical protein